MLWLLVYGAPVVLAFVGMIWLVSRRGASRSGKKTGNEPSLERAKLEEDLLARLERLKRKTDHVADAVDRDPRRAANAVRAMMKDKTGRKS